MGLGLFLYIYWTLVKLINLEKKCLFCLFLGNAALNETINASAATGNGKVYEGV